MGLLSAYFDRLKNSLSGQWSKYLILRLLLSLGAVGSSIGFFYILGYLFLYGYYFGNTDKNTIPSFIEVLLNNVPFSHTSVTFIGFIYLLTISIISIWLLLLVKNAGKRKEFWSYLGAGLILITTISAPLSLFFLGKLSFEIIIIWALPLILILWLTAFVKTINKPLVLIAAFFNSIYFVICYALVIAKTNISQTDQNDIALTSFILFIFIPIFSLTFTSRKFSISNKTLFIVPFLLSITIILTSELVFSRGILGYILTILTSYFLTFGIILWIRKKCFINKTLSEKHDQVNAIYPIAKPIESVDFEKLKKMSPLLSIVLVSLFFISLIFIPYPAFETGKYIRTIIEPKTSEAITINDKTYVGHVVAYKDGIFYISYKWELLKIRSDQALIGNGSDRDLFPTKLK